MKRHFKEVLTVKEIMIRERLVKERKPSFLDKVRATSQNMAKTMEGVVPRKNRKWRFVWEK